MGTLANQIGAASSDHPGTIDSTDSLGTRSQPSGGGIMVMSSSFENPTAPVGQYDAPCLDYPFATDQPERWDMHSSRSGVISSCDGNTAYEGSTYYHHQFGMGMYDPCIDSTTTTVEMTSRSNMGLNLDYPTTNQMDFTLTGSCASNTIVLRCAFRCVGDWTSANNVIDGGGGLKFVRVFGTGGTTDTAAALIKLKNSGDSTDPIWNLYDPSGETWSEYNYEFQVGINVQDGNWHTLCFRVVRNRPDNGTGNITSTMWVDDWDMVGTGVSRTITCTTYGSANSGYDWQYIEWLANWSAAYPDYPIAMDLDKIEVWDGMP